MRILVFNSGSSSLKVELVDTRAGTSQKVDKPNIEGVSAIVHRVVHGGDALVTTMRIDDAVVARIEALEPLAPLHNAIAVATIKQARGDFPQVPHYAVFDTAFHASMPEASKTYALSRAVAERYGIRRYGFHGISYAYLASMRPSGRVIALHLGNGASMCAIKDGKSIATSMGFTPAQGLVMGTRCGDIDPGVLTFLARNGWDPEDIDTLINYDSGLLGLCGHSDMREVTDPLTLSIFRTRIIEYVGAYMARLQGVDTIIFTGGIGEHDAATRAYIVEQLGWCGAVLDVAANATNQEGTISSPTSSIEVLVIAAREALQMAREVEGAILSAGTS